MTTVIIASDGIEETASESVRLQILVRDDDFVGMFDSLEVWRADEEGGPYLELTAPSLLAARLPKYAQDEGAATTGALVALVGKDLDFLVNGEEYTVAFEDGTNPRTYAQAVTEFNTKSDVARVYVSPLGEFVLETLGVGLSTTLEVTSSEAAVTLGLPYEPTDSQTFGREARIPLTPGVNIYSFTDPYSAQTYFYKTRFRDSISGSVSAFSLPFSAVATVGVSQDNLVLGTLDLVHANGAPVQNQEVLVHVEGANLVESRYVAHDDIVLTTDTTGHVETTLVRGLVITVAIVGSDVIRRMTVPTDTSVSSFSMLDPDITDQDDWFRVRVPQVVVASRRSL